MPFGNALGKWPNDRTLKENTGKTKPRTQRSRAGRTCIVEPIEMIESEAANPSQW